MEKITSKETLIAALKQMRAMEVKARDNYVSDMQTFSDIHITSTIESIKKDEDKHIQIIDGLLENLEG